MTLCLYLYLVPSNHPTAIQTRDVNTLFCLTPTDVTSCDNFPDGTKIKFLTPSDRNCNKTHMLFSLSTDGILTHHCSGKMVCPSDDGEYLIISSKCKIEDSQYERTDKVYLFHFY